MREITGDLFAQTTADAIVVATNMQTKSARGGVTQVAIMGAGVAKRAAELYDWLPYQLAIRMMVYGPEHVYVFDPEEHADADQLAMWEPSRGEAYEPPPKLVCLPTKRDWRGSSDLDLIYDMLIELRRLTNAMGWEEVALPRLGCGNGGLAWRDVKDLLETVFGLDDRLVVVTPKDR